LVALWFSGSLLSRLYAIRLEDAARRPATLLSPENAQEMAGRSDPHASEPGFKEAQRRTAQ
jgi:hypothetical protein